MGEVTRCGSCGSRQLNQILDLGYQPLAENDNGNKYPLELMKCASCALVQLSFIPDQEEMFPKGHPYATGNTKFMQEHFAQLVWRLQEHLSPEDLIVDIGANDGTFLDEFLPDEVRRVAVEPTDQVKKCRDKGIISWQEFFTSKTAGKLLGDCGSAKVITAMNVLAHVPDPHDFLDGVTTLLADDGVFITENHDWASIVNGLQIDTIYHEHLRYYTVASLSRLLAAHGLLVFEVEQIPTHGGSFRVYALREEVGLAARAKKLKDEIRQMVSKAAEEGPVYGISATTRATPLIHYTGIQDYITCVCEIAGSEKIGTNIPGTKIPIVDEAKLIEDQPPNALLLAWHIAGDIIPALDEAGYKGKFIIPFLRLGNE